jgi:hypothetical protein
MVNVWVLCALQHDSSLQYCVETECVASLLIDSKSTVSVLCVPVYFITTVTCKNYIHNKN